MKTARVLQLAIAATTFGLSAAPRMYAQRGEAAKPRPKEAKPAARTVTEKERDAKTRATIARGDEHAKSGVENVRGAVVPTTPPRPKRLDGQPSPSRCTHTWIQPCRNCFAGRMTR